MPRTLSPSITPQTSRNHSTPSPLPPRTLSLSISAPNAHAPTPNTPLPTLLLSEDTSSPPTDDEPLQTRIERLGRQRPPTFPTLWRESIFVFSIIMSQFLTEFFVSGFTVILPTLIKELNIPQASSVWPATAFSLVIASTLLVFGRLGDMFGGKPVFLGGLAWLVVWSVIAGFSTTPLMLDICRALQGLGASAILPSGVMLMGSLYRPGPRKNLVFAIYGTSAVFGFFGGIAVAGVVGQYLRWGFYFWIGGALAAVTLVSATFSIPRGPARKEGSAGEIKMDYPGALSASSSASSLSSPSSLSKRVSRPLRSFPRHSSLQPHP